MAKQKTWMGSPIRACDFCKESLEGKNFVDGATRYGPWAIMCEVCCKEHGRGIGQGRGQLYDKDRNKIGG